jgi:hypothetical protein
MEAWNHYEVNRYTIALVIAAICFLSACGDRKSSGSSRSTTTIVASATFVAEKIAESRGRLEDDFRQTTDCPGARSVATCKKSLRALSDDAATLADTLTPIKPPSGVASRFARTRDAGAAVASTAKDALDCLNSAGSTANQTAECRAKISNVTTAVNRLQSIFKTWFPYLGG